MPNGQTFSFKKLPYVIHVFSIIINNSVHKMAINWDHVNGRTCCAPDRVQVSDLKCWPIKPAIDPAVFSLHGRIFSHIHMTFTSRCLQKLKKKKIEINFLK